MSRRKEKRVKPAQRPERILVDREHVRVLIRSANLLVCELNEISCKPTVTSKRLLPPPDLRILIGEIKNLKAYVDGCRESIAEVLAHSGANGDRGLLLDTLGELASGIDAARLHAASAEEELSRLVGVSETAVTS